MVGMTNAECRINDIDNNTRARYDPVGARHALPVCGNNVGADEDVCRPMNMVRCQIEL
jgi:hypothetical protein